MADDSFNNMSNINQRNDNNKYGYFFGKSRSKTLYQEGQNSSNKSIRGAQSMPHAPTTHYRKKSNTILTKRFHSSESAPQDIDQNLRVIIQQMISDSTKDLVGAVSELTERVAKLEEESKRCDYNTSFKISDLKFRMTIVEDKLTTHSSKDEEDSGYVDAMDKIIFKGVQEASIKSPQPSLRKSSQEEVTESTRKIPRKAMDETMLKEKNQSTPSKPPIPPPPPSQTTTPSPSSAVSIVTPKPPPVPPPSPGNMITAVTNEQLPVNRTRARTRVSRGALVSFMKLMRRGVLPKVLAGQLSSAVAAVEPSLTELLSDIAKKSDGRLVGLEYKFKTMESLVSKINRCVNDANLKVLEDMEKRRKFSGSTASKAYLSGEKKQKKLRRESKTKLQEKRNSSNQEQAELLIETQKQADELAQESAEKVIKAVMEIEAQAEKEGKNEVDIPAIAWKISDALRYTVVINTDKYTECVRDALERLKAAGMTPASLKNYWGPGDGYQGINDVFFVPSTESPTGQVKVEIQFHTPESFDHKMTVHGLYEEFRTTRDPTRKIDLWRLCVSMADAIPVPLDVVSLPTLKTQSMPIETTLYADLVIDRALKIQQPALDIVTKIMKNLKLPSYFETQKIVPNISSHLLSRQTVEFKLNSEMVNADRKSVFISGGVMDSSVNSEDVILDLKLKDAALRINDALVINVVIDSDIYTTVTELAMTEIFNHSKSVQDGGSCSENIVGCMVEKKTTNAWSSPILFKRTGLSGGVGVYCHVTMEGEDDGVAFTPDDAYPLIIAFHTEQSLSARVGLLAAWSNYRIANTKKQRNVAVMKAQRLTGKVPVPLGARGVRSPSWADVDGESDESEDEEDNGEVDDDSDASDEDHSLWH